MGHGVSLLCVSVRPLWDMASAPIDESQCKTFWDTTSASTYESQCKTCLGHGIDFDVPTSCRKVAHESLPYVGEASHTIPKAFGIASFIILIMACIRTSVFVMVTLFWAKRVAFHSY
ncbi:Coagulation factor IX/factor X-binding subunit A [Gossypium arboreum]|uniref:Coagulation factor IX/factor X-binding subunit A n=1 Tax=Gossypium arboreum TaxID=29729 RepID=A0A0B0NG72_GOSAR|nr:Coagulation factor IX/factor X-binding subunit A [Gossypium arboreum]